MKPGAILRILLIGFGRAFAMRSLRPREDSPPDLTACDNLTSSRKTFVVTCSDLEYLLRHVDVGVLAVHELAADPAMGSQTVIDLRYTISTMSITKSTSTEPEETTSISSENEG